MNSPLPPEKNTREIERTLAEASFNIDEARFALIRYGYPDQEITDYLRTASEKIRRAGVWVGK